MVTSSFHPLPPDAQIRVFSYVDGAYLRIEGKKRSISYPNPQTIVAWALNTDFSSGGFQGDSYRLRRTSFYDASPENTPTDADLQKYWDDIELLPNTDLRFGELRGKPRRQKGVDVLLAVDMLSAAHLQIFDTVLLLAGDADFAPLVREVRRHGVTVVVAADDATVSSELRREADRFVSLSKDTVGV